MSYSPYPPDRRWPGDNYPRRRHCPPCPPCPRRRRDDWRDRDRRHDGWRDSSSRDGWRDSSSRGW